MKEKIERTKIIRRAIEESLKKPVHFGYWSELARTLNIKPQMLNTIKNRIIKREEVKNR